MLLEMSPQTIFCPLQVLIGQGADLTTPDKEGWTALHCAASAGFLDVVKLLVESGASPDVRILFLLSHDTLFFRL